MLLADTETKVDLLNNGAIARTVIALLRERPVFASKFSVGMVCVPRAFAIGKWLGVVANIVIVLTFDPFPTLNPMLFANLRLDHRIFQFE